MAVKENKITLESRHRRFIVGCWAQFYTFQETIDAFMERFDADIKRQVPCDEHGELMREDEFRKWLYSRIHYHRNDPKAKRWQDLMKDLRAAWLAGFAEERFSHKRFRLAELTKLYDKLSTAVSRGETMLKSVRTGPEQWTVVYDHCTKQLMDLIAEMRRESEPDYTLFADFDLSQLSDEQLERLASGENILAILATQSSGDVGVESSSEEG